MRRFETIAMALFYFISFAWPAHSQPAPKRVYIISIDSMRADYLSQTGTDGKSLTPNLDAFRKKGVTFTNCFDTLTALTATNHVATISGASAARSGILGAGGFFVGFDDAGKAVLRLYDFADLRVPTLYDSVKKADPKAKTAVISGKHWVSDLFGHNNPAVDIEIHGRKFPSYVNAPKGYWLGGPIPVGDKSGLPRIYLRDESEPSKGGLMDFVGMTATHAPSDDWVTDAAIAVVKNDDPALIYLLYAVMDDSGHIYGSFNVPPDRSAFQNQQAMRDQMRISDAAVGRFLDFLESSGRLKDSVVVITADHGMTSTRDPYRLPPGATLQGFVKNPLSLPLKQIGTQSVDIKKILSDAGYHIRSKTPPGAEPDYDYVFSEGSTAYIFGARPERLAGMLMTLNAWNDRQPAQPIWRMLTRDEMQSATNDKTGQPFRLFDPNAASGKNPAGPWPDVILLLNEGYINVIYMDAIQQGMFALMAKGKLDMLPPSIEAFPFIPGAHGSWAEQHVPLLIASPGLSAGTVREENVSLLDIAPTVSHLIPDWPVPAAAEGKSLF